MQRQISLFNSVPEEIIIIIFKFLNAKELVNASMVSKKWLNVTKDKSLTYKFWERIPEEGWRKREATQVFFYSEKYGMEHRDSPAWVSTAQVIYDFAVNESANLKSIVINIYPKKPYEIIFQKPKNKETFEKILTEAGCYLFQTNKIIGDFKTTDYLQALTGLKDYLPLRVINAIREEFKNGDLLLNESREILKKYSR